MSAPAEVEPPSSRDGALSPTCVRSKPARSTNDDDDGDDDYIGDDDYVGDDWAGQEAARPQPMPVPPRALEQPGQPV